MLVAVMCMPASLLEAAAFGPGFGFGFGMGFGPGFGFGWGGPNVLTNASVKFKDAATNKVIGEVDSGETFKLVITISGNNVHQFGPTSKYRIEITDGNLLLTNFKDDGFFNGAKYNGYKLVYDKASGKRYIEFSIRNGSTQTIQLNAKFANGITEDGHTSTVKLVDTFSNASVSGSIKANAKFSWVDDKTATVTEISTDSFGNGSVDFKLYAAPSYTSSDTGVVWATGLQFTDTITLSEGMTFKSAEDVKAAFSVDGVTINNVELEGSNKAKITWSVNSDYIKDGKPYAEMQAFDKIAKLNLNCIELSDDFTTGSLSNMLNVAAKTYGSSGYEYNLGDADVSLAVKSNPAKFDMDKSLETSLCVSDTYATKSYFVVGNKVVFRLTSKNVGGKAGKLIMTDTYPAGLTYESAEVFVNNEKIDAAVTHNEAGKTIEISCPDNIGAGKEAYALVSFTVDEPGSDVLYLKNTVENNYNSSSDETITVKKLSAGISVTKTSNISRILMGNDTEVKYRIVVTNSGTQPLTGVTVTDALSDFAGSCAISSASWTQAELSL